MHFCTICEITLRGTGVSYMCDMHNRAVIAVIAPRSLINFCKGIYVVLEKSLKMVAIFCMNARPATVRNS